MELKRLSLAVCMLALLTSAAAQLDDCDLDELFADTSSELRRLMAVAITSGDNPAEPVITVVRNHTVCLSVGPTIGKISSISLVIDYMCTSSGFCPEGGRATEQFDFGCNPQGEWVFDQFFDVDNGRTRNPLADFDTGLREDCGACFPVHPDTENPRTIDPVTHCHECECGGGVGRNACFDTGIGACCNVYVNGVCAESCPSEGTYVIDPDTYVCTRLCEDLGNTAVGGSVTYSQSRIEGGYPVGSVARVACTRGYTGGGDITCQNGNWTGSLPGCSVMDCGSPPSLENGKVMSLTGTTFESTVTYECDENYLFADEDVKSRTCLESGSWSDEDIRCEQDVKDCDPMCKNGGTCDTFTGLCICPPGFTGNDCGLRLCPECRNGGSCDPETGMCVCPEGFIGLECGNCSIPDCTECIIQDGKFVCVECKEDFEKSGDDKCEAISGDKDDELCILCIILPIVAVILAIIAAIAIAAGIYAYMKWKNTPATKLKDKEANGLNGVARDNPLYLDPAVVEQEVG